MIEPVLRAVAVFLVLAGSQTPPQTPPPQQPWRPPAPSNLQFFPKETTSAELIAAMKGFTRALGVRCEFCHVGEGNDLSKFDFASDERRQKKNARVMLQMTRDLNTRLEHIPEPRPAGAAAVTCYTCHRGQQEPLTAAPAQ